MAKLMVLVFLALFGMATLVNLPSVQAGGGGCIVFGGIETSHIDGGCLFVSPDGNVRTDKVPDGWYALYDNTRAEAGTTITVTQASFYQYPVPTATPTSTPTSTALPQPWENLRQQVLEWCKASSATCKTEDLQISKGNRPNEIVVKTFCSNNCGLRPMINIPVRNVIQLGKGGENH